MLHPMGVFLNINQARVAPGLRANIFQAPAVITEGRGDFIMFNEKYLHCAKNSRTGKQLQNPRFICISIRLPMCFSK